MDTKIFQYAQIYDVPTVCKSCGGVLVYRGLGSTAAKSAGERTLTIMGKHAIILRKTRAPSAVDIEKNTGVSKVAIREMLKESRFEIVEGTKSFLRCEGCGKEIRSGRYCEKCEKDIHLAIERQQREKLRENIQGYMLEKSGEKGQRRFVRDK